MPYLSRQPQRWLARTLRTLFLSLALHTPHAMALEIDEIELSSDETKLAVGFTNGSLSVYDLPSATFLNSYPGIPDESLSYMAFSHDNQTILFGDWDDHLFLWDVEDGDILEQENLVNETLYAVSPLPNNKGWGLMLNETGFQLRSPDLDDRLQTFPADPNSFMSLAQGRYMLYSNNDAAVIYNTHSQQVALTLNDDYQNSVYFDMPDLQQFLILDSDSDWQLVDYSSDAIRQIPLTTAKPFYINEAATAAAAPKLITYSHYDQDFTLWDIQRTADAASLINPQKMTASEDLGNVVIDAAGEYAAITFYAEDSTTQQPRIEIWDLRKQALHFTIHTTTHLVGYTNLLLRNQQLIVNAQSHLERWDLTTQKLIDRIYPQEISSTLTPQQYFTQAWPHFGSPEKATALLSSPQGHLLALPYGGQSQTYEIQPNGQVAQVYSPAKTATAAAAYSHDGKWLALASSKTDVNVFNTATADFTQRLHHHPDGFQNNIFSMQFSLDDRQLFIAGSDSKWSVWSHNNGKFTLQKQGQLLTDAAMEAEDINPDSLGIYQVAWLPNGQILLGFGLGVQLGTPASGNFTPLTSTAVTTIMPFEHAGQWQALIGHYEEPAIIMNAEGKKTHEIEITELYQAGYWPQQQGLFLSTYDGMSKLNLADFSVTEIYNDDTVFGAGGHPSLLVYNPKTESIWGTFDQEKMLREVISKDGDVVKPPVQGGLLERLFGN